MSKVQTVQLPPDVQYALDCLLEHHEIDAGTHTAIRLYAPRAEVIRIIDHEEAETPRKTMWQRLARADVATLAVSVWILGLGAGALLIGTLRPRASRRTTLLPGRLASPGLLTPTMISGPTVAGPTVTGLLDQ